MKYFLIFFLVLSSFSTNAQNYLDILKLTYTTTPLTGFENGTDQTRVEEMDIQLNVPIPISEKTTLLTGIIADRTQLKLDPNVSLTTLTSVVLKLGINQLYSEKWSGTYFILPKIASDFNALTNRDTQLGGLVLLTYKKRENFSYKFGFYANSEEFGPLLLPLVGFYYLSPNKKFEANVILPAQFDVNYKVVEKVGLGVNFDGRSTSYALHTSEYSLRDKYVAKVSNDMYAYATYQISKSIYIRTKIGYAIGRKYRVYDADDKVDVAMSAIFLGDDREQLNQNIESGLMYKAELLYRFNL